MMRRSLLFWRRTYEIFLVELGAVWKGNMMKSAQGRALKVLITNYNNVRWTTVTVIYLDLNKLTERVTIPMQQHMGEMWKCYKNSIKKAFKRIPGSTPGSAPGSVFAPQTNHSLPWPMVQLFTKLH